MTHEAPAGEDGETSPAGAGELFVTPNTRHSQNNQAASQQQEDN